MTKTYCDICEKKLDENHRIGYATIEHVEVLRKIHLIEVCKECCETIIFKLRVVIQDIKNETGTR